MTHAPSAVQASEKVAVAILLLRILALFGLVVAVTDYLNGNYLVAGASATIALLTPVVLWLGRQPRLARLPLHFCIWLLFCMFALGTFTQLPMHPSKAVWIPIFPFAYFYLTGLRFGRGLSVTSLALMLLGYPVSVLVLDMPVRMSWYAFSQSVGAFILSSIFAYLYERVRVEQSERLLDAANHDPLTGLLNRRGFAPLANAVLQQALRFGHDFAVVLIDLDDFKKINDTQGHEAGDCLLRDVAALLQQHTRQTDLIARWGGEEFILLLVQSPLDSAATVAQKICAAIAARSFSTGHITASIGLAMHDATHASLETTVNLADSAMYRAKEMGKNQVVIHPPATAR
jgi:diguanylate cyclase (GGDEF)-like protein